MINVYWLTCRSMDDLCVTTHRALLKGLSDKGLAITLLNPDQVPENDIGNPWSHIQISNSSVPGFAARTMAKGIRSWMDRHVFEENAVAVLDWRIAHRLVPTLNRLGVPWTVLDRSPPAHAGLMARLQWPSWKRAWRRVEQNQSSKGFVVSPSHRRLVMNQTGTSEENIIVLPAGVDLELFQPARKRERFTLVYHGRLDRNRGVMALPMLVQKARTAGIEVDLVLVGDGDAVTGLSRIATQLDGFELHSTMPQPDVAAVLGSCHVGLLPMPDTPVWAVSSPLKQCEYAASGLAMLGIDHQGHRLRKIYSAPWLKLLPQEDFFSEGIPWLVQLQQTPSGELGGLARRFAEAELSWDSTVETLYSALLELSTVNA